MTKRTPLTQSAQDAVLLASRRRCCLCVFLDNRDGPRRGQIAHLNHDASDCRFENLVWLCLEHHDAFDSKTSVSKGLTPSEVQEYRDRLYAQYGPEVKRQFLNRTLSTETDKTPSRVPVSEREIRKSKIPDRLSFISTPWRYPLWQVANEPDFFAYKAGNRADGVCLVERVDLPDGRIVMACIETAGNPGCSISNSVEELCFQICERFEMPADRVVWLQNYDYDEEQEWMMVTFAQTPLGGPFEDPTWVEMTPDMWRSLRMKPRKRLRNRGAHFESKLIKLFPWPMEALL